jgi:hypothetical protein
MSTFLFASSLNTHCLPRFVLIAIKIIFSAFLCLSGPTELIKQFGVTDILPFLSKFLRWGFNFRHNPYHCDCHMYGISYWYRRLQSYIWRDYFNVSCQVTSWLLRS